MSDSSFQDAHARVVEALADETLTAGASVQWTTPYVIAGNMAYDAPALSPLAIDDLGRIWKERHHGGSHELVCVFDLRTLHPPRIVPADFDAGDASSPGHVTWRKAV